MSTDHGKEVYTGYRSTVGDRREKTGVKLVEHGRAGKVHKSIDVGTTEERIHIF